MVGGGGGAGAWRERVCCQEQMLNFLPFLFPRNQSGCKRAGWEKELGKGEVMSPLWGVSIHGLNYFHNLAILVCQREDDTLFVMHSSRIMTQLAVLSLSPPFHVRELAFPIFLPLIFSQRYNDTFEFDHWWLSVMVLIPHLRMFSLFNESYSIFLQCFSYHGNGIFFS